MWRVGFGQVLLYCGAASAIWNAARQSMVVEILLMLLTVSPQPPSAF